ncbi:MAG: Maf family protein [Lachnospiraceae bacterium]|nr:Maf family protein [Lachnospiraceae bacterium]
MRVILASASPRRIELMRRLFKDFDVMPACGEEKSEETAPDKYVIALASAKAFEIEEKVKDSEDEYIIIGADTVVSKDGNILGKPKDSVDAERMIHMLEGDKHQVYTGVSLIVNDSMGRRNIGFAEKTDVKFNKMTREEIIDYINYRDENGSPEWEDKAGAYAIQGYCSKYIAGIFGDFYNVVGFPIAEIYRRLNFK